MNDNVQRAYNAIAMLDLYDSSGGSYLDPMDLHMLRSTAWRIQVLLGKIEVDPTENLDAAAYMAGYEDESK